MSLAGNLSDLSLPELLQVVALSRKTGALEICSEEGGVAWLGLRDGGIVRVALESGDLNRDEILKKAGLAEGGDSDVAAAMLWDAAVQAILNIFDWHEGDFTFEPLDDPAIQWRGPQGILLPSPLSPEFLALEGARLEDENAASNVDVVFEGEDSAAASESPAEADDAEDEDEADEEDVAEEEGGDEAEVEEAEIEVEAEAAPAPVAPIIEPPPEEEPAPPELEALPSQPEPPESPDDDTPLRLSRSGRGHEPLRPDARDPDATIAQAIPVLTHPAKPAAAAKPGATPATRPAAARALPASLICIDGDLPLLERMKAGLAGKPIRVHIFQSPNDALARFKQYVIRGEIPAVVLGSGVEDPLDARQGLGWRRFAGRLLAISPRLRMVVLAKVNENVAAPGWTVIQRPEARPQAADVDRFLRALCDALASDA
ncbi:MAG TPA: DUF4388 domain-containing protein [Myxococcota bacterium]|nr:DUF4388 domain-containing protein [Myxococcota bacterium]